MPEDGSIIPSEQDIDKARDTVSGAAEIGKQLAEEADWTAIFQSWEFKALIALATVLLLFWGYRRIRRIVRKVRGPKIHPLLQKYSGQPDAKDEKLAVARRQQAEKIIATSSSGAIVGYELVEQIEAVYVDGFKRPEEAIEGLKAAAAMKGANAVVSVHQERNSAGRCSAHGDAVVVRRPGAAAADKRVSRPAAHDSAEPRAAQRPHVTADDAITPSTGDDAEA